VFCMVGCPDTAHHFPFLRVSCSRSVLDSGKSAKICLLDPKSSTKLQKAQVATSYHNKVPSPCYP